MALVKNSFGLNFGKRVIFTSRLCGAFIHEKAPKNIISDDVLEARRKDLPIELEKNPFEKDKVVCVLCKYDIEPDYKNVQLLSQFVSRFTGRLYERNITGLCQEKQNKVEEQLLIARKAGLMPYVLKEAKFFKDPSLYDPENPIRPHKY